MKIRSKAPLRLGLAGGGTDVSPYSDKYGGCVLNATINMYAHAFICDDVNGHTAQFIAKDLGLEDSLDLNEPITIDGPLILHRAVYKRIMEEFNDGIYLSVVVTTWADVPPGSGLGSSSTMVVAMLEGYRQLLSLPLGEYELAHLAFEIERIDCGLAGGKQDTYAATFGGFNFIEFYKQDRVIVNPLRIRRYIVSELESSMILFFTGVSRSSAKIIDDQIRSISIDVGQELNAMHEVKARAYDIKESLFKADIDSLVKAVKSSWESKKTISSLITNDFINEIEARVYAAGAKAMKVSGAGGGGFMMIFVEPELRQDIVDALGAFDGQVHNFQFIDEGAYSWTI